MKKAIIVGVAIGAGVLGYAFWPGTAPKLAAPELAAPELAAPELAAQAASGAPLVAVVVPQTLSQTAQMGQTAYGAKCAACHGAGAAGQDGVAPPLVHKIYEPSHHGDESFQRAAQLGVQSHHWPFGDMPPVEGVTRSDVMTIIAYVRELQRANGIE